jgi:hypothetical protein
MIDALIKRVSVIYKCYEMYVTKDLESTNMIGADILTYTSNHQLKTLNERNIGIINKTKMHVLTSESMFVYIRTRTLSAKMVNFCYP